MSKRRVEATSTGGVGYARNGVMGLSPRRYGEVPPKPAWDIEYVLKQLHQVALPELMAKKDSPSQD